VNWVKEIGSSERGMGFDGNSDLRQTNIAVSNIKETRIWIMVIGANLGNFIQKFHQKEALRKVKGGRLTVLNL
jgi:hypothetical protein